MASFRNYRRKVISPLLATREIFSLREQKKNEEETGKKNYPIYIVYSLFTAGGS